MESLRRCAGSPGADEPAGSGPSASRPEAEGSASPSSPTPLIDDKYLGRAGPTARGHGLYEQMQRRLSVLLPICAYCKRVREGEAEPPPGAPPSTWGPYELSGSGIGFTHCVCPDCYEKEIVPQLEALKRRSRSAG